jgi:hypothetical protein
MGANVILWAVRKLAIPYQISINFKLRNNERIKKRIRSNNV